MPNLQKSRKELKLLFPSKQTDSDRLLHIVFHKYNSEALFNYHFLNKRVINFQFLLAISRLFLFQQVFTVTRLQNKFMCLILKKKNSKN